MTQDAQAAEAAPFAVPVSDPAAGDPRPRARGFEAPPRPRGRPFQPGVSGNPAGRPARAGGPVRSRGRAVPLEPTELEKALAVPVYSPQVDAAEPVSLARALVARLTEKAMTYGDVSAARELLRLLGEADVMRAERELMAAEAEALAEQEAARAAEEAAEAEARAAEAAERAVEAEAKRARSLQLAAQFRLEELAIGAAWDAGQQKLEEDDRALLLLDAAEIEGHECKAVKPWVVEAAQAHDPALPRGGDRPLDLTDPFDALRRLDILHFGDEDDHLLSGWFIDAARARRPDLKLAAGDEALLLLIRDDGDDEEPDWMARLERVAPGEIEGAREDVANAEDPDFMPPQGDPSTGVDWDHLEMSAATEKRRNRIVKAMGGDPDGGAIP